MEIKLLNSQKGSPRVEAGFIPVLILLLISAVLIGGYLYLTKLNTTNLPSLPQQLFPKSQKLFLNLESPTANTVAVDNAVLIKGKTLANTTIVMFNEAGEEALESDQNGNFQGMLQLLPGDNTLTVTAFSEQGEEKTLSVNIVYQPGS